MTNTDKLQTLRDHQAWRMGADTAPPLVGDITAAIDYAIECVEAVQMLEEWIDSGDLDPDSLVRGIRARMVPK
jgi:hypothetical protein